MRGVGETRRPATVGTRGPFLSGWGKTAPIVGGLIALLALAVWLDATGRLDALRYLNVPLIHPYPPSGYEQNPFGARGDLIRVSEAMRVKADFLADGRVELDAVATDDSALPPRADTGTRLARIQAIVARQGAQGISARSEDHFDSVVAGQGQDRFDPALRNSWMVEERGWSTVTYSSRKTGQVIQRESFRFDGKFWLVKRGSHYLIQDADVVSSPLTGGA